MMGVMLAFTMSHLFFRSEEGNYVFKAVTYEVNTFYRIHLSLLVNYSLAKHIFHLHTHTFSIVLSLSLFVHLCLSLYVTTSS